MLPQSVWAGITSSDEGATLTITSTAPGQVAGFLASYSGNRSDVTKIIFKGKFSGSDLSAVSYSAGFTNVATVDMSEAQFKAAQSSTYKKLSSTSDAGNSGDKGVVGGTLYKTTGTTVHTWTPITAATFDTQVGNQETPSWSERERSSHLDEYANKYVKVMLAHYYHKESSQKAVTVNTKALADKFTTVTQENIDNKSVDQNTVFARIETGTKYYQYTKSGDDDVWTEVASNAGSFTDDNTDYRFKSSEGLITGNYYSYKVYSYYLLKHYDPIETSAVPSDALVYYPSNPDWAATEEGRIDKADESHEYIGTAVGYNYYHHTTSTSYSWETSSDTPSEVHYVVNSADDLPTATANKYAIVGGTVYAHDGTGWKTSSAAENQVNDYSQMKFTYWSSSLTTAITSNTADTSIANDIFSGCTQLTSVDYRSGNLTGFGDHDTDHGYTSGLSVTVGKDVTVIESSAFKDCNVLTTLTFEKTSKDAGDGYPKVLTINENAFLNCSALTSVSIPNRVNQIGNGAFKNAGIVTLNFDRRYSDEGANDYKDFDVPLTIGAGAFEDCTALTSLTLPVRVVSIGTRSFANTSSLTSLTMREPGDSNHPLKDMTNSNVSYTPLQTIPSQAFSGSHVTEIKVPSSVTLIESAAFQQTNYLKKITFQNTNTTPLVIKSGAFAGGREEGTPVLDVYVNVNPDSRKIVCEYDAFTYTQMEGQTSVESHQFAKLHFDKQYWDYYQGNWKRGLAFRQDNLNAFKDGYNRDNDVKPDYIGKANTNNVSISTTTGKYETGNEETIYTPGNGWQQFAGTDTEIDIQIPRGSFMRTYSTNTAYVIPTFAEKDDSYNIKAGDPMFQIFRVTAFSDGFKLGESDAGSASQAQAAKRIATATEVTITDKNGLKYIPKETGLLMVGNINANYVVYFADAEFDGSHPQTTYPYDKRSGAYTNMLYPTCIDEQNLKGDGTTDQTSETGQPSIVDNDEKVLVNSTIPFPYYDVKDVQFRFFGYSSANNQFLRVKGAKFNRDKAYLKLPADLFHWTSEYNPSDPNSSITNEDPGSARIALNFIDDEEGETTGIKQVNTTLSHTDSNVFYTLEGVRLNSRPTQRGIYIHNGRKIVIK